MIAGLELTRLNQRDRTGEHALTIGGDDWTDHARDLVAEFREQNGGSRLTFTSREPMERLVERPVKLWVGEGIGMRELFTGRLIRPMPDPPTFTSAAVGLGPFSQMGEQQLGDFIDFPADGFNTVRLALQEINKRAGFAQGTAVVLGNADQAIEDLALQEENSLLEAAGGVCEPAGFVMTDTNDGRRLYLKQPKAGGGIPSGLEFRPRDYSEFQIEDVYPTSFAFVVVRNRSDSEGGGFRVKVPVPQRIGQMPAPKNRIKYVTDFVGSDVQATQHAHDLAQRIARGEIKWSATGLELRYVERYTKVVGVREIERMDGWYREEYDLTTDEGGTYNIAAWQMELGGLGVIREASKIAPLRILDFGPLAAVLRTKVTLASVSGTRATSWNIAEATTSVSGTRATSWNISQTKTGTRTTSWNVDGTSAAAPTLQGTPGVSTPTGNSTNIPVVMPTGATIQADDLLVAVFAKDGDNTAGFSGLPSGWAAVQSSSGLDGTVGMTWKRAVGGETGFNITSDTDRYMCRTFLVRGANPSGTPIAIAFATGTSNAPNPPNNNPAWGTHNTLCIAACAVDYAGVVTNITSAPSGYSNLADDKSGGTSTGAVGLGTASRTASGISSEDPAAFGIDVSQVWGAATILVRPA